MARSLSELCLGLIKKYLLEGEDEGVMEGVLGRFQSTCERKRENGM